MGIKEDNIYIIPIECIPLFLMKNRQDLGIEENLGYSPPSVTVGLILIVVLYIARNRTPNLDCYWVGAVPKVNPKLFLHEATEMLRYLQSPGLKDSKLARLNPKPQTKLRV